DLAGVNAERHLLEAAGLTEIATFEHGFTELTLADRIDRSKGASDHRADQVVVIEAFGIGAEHRGAILHHQDAIRDLEYLLDAMRDVDHRCSTRSELADLAQHGVSL